MRLQLLSGLRITTGIYSGMSSVNMPVEHYLDREPWFVDITIDTVGRTFRIYRGIGEIKRLDIESALSVTVPDGTNFYVGNVVDYTASANVNTSVYRWFAFG